jgi:hypothetical protein
LPLGVILDESTGVIGGTPLTAQAAVFYTVTAENAAGSTTATLSIEVRELEVPTGLLYPTSSVSYGAPGTDIPPLVPTSQGGAITHYSVTPALPVGLVIDDATGVISGRPTTPTAGQAYEVTGTNPLGSTSTHLSVTTTRRRRVGPRRGQQCRPLPRVEPSS